MIHYPGGDNERYHRRRVTPSSSEKQKKGYTPSVKPIIGILGEK